MIKSRQSILGFIIVIVIWQIVSWLNVFNPIYFASPYEVVREAFIMMNKSDIYLDVFFTLKRVLVSIFISSFIGIPLGIIIGYFHSVYKYVGEFMDFLRSIPPIVIYPLLLIVLGPDDSSRIGVAVFGSVIVLILIISKGLSQQSPIRRYYFRILGADKIHIIKHIVWYESLPYVMVGLRTSVSLSIIIIVVTEMLVGSKYGLGTRIQNVQITSNIPDLFVTIIIIGLFGVLLNKLLIWIDKKYVFWRV